MADLQGNNTYNTGTPLAARLGTLNSLRGITPVSRTQYATPSSFENLGRRVLPTPDGGEPTSQSLGAPVGAPIESNVGAPKYQDIPGYYSGFVPGGNYMGFKWNDPNLDSTTLRNYPGIEGQGVVDRSQPGSIIKSDRGLDQQARAAILGGRSSQLYQVDHIIPLWLGGADTEANLQVLSRPEHDKKTKAQAVAYTLLLNGRLTPDQARTYALNWKDRDLTDLPAVDDYGVMKLDDAERVRALWDRQATEAPKVTFSDFLSAIPDGSKNLARNLKGFFGIEGNVLPDTPYTKLFTKPAEEFVKGFAGGLTANWVPYQPGEDNNAIDTAFGMAGMLVGQLLPIGMISKGLGFGANLTGAALRGTSVAQKAGIIADATKNANGIVTTIKAPSFAQGVMRRVAVDNLVKNAAAFTVYGQLTPEAVEDRSARFWTDMSLGLLAPIGGYSVASMARINPANLALNTATESLGVGAAASMISFMSDGNPQNAIVNGGVMAALHGAGLPAARAQAANLEKAISIEASRMANNYLSTYVPRIKQLKESDVVPPPMSQDEIINVRGEAMKSLDTALSDGKMTLEQYVKERAGIFAATRQLEKDGLPPEMRRRQDILDLFSVAQQSKRLEGLSIETPPLAFRAAEVIDDSLLQNSYKANDGGVVSGKYPVGSIRLKGMASDQNPYTDNLKQFYKDIAAGKASPTVIMVDRPELAPIWRSINNTITAEQVAARTKSPSQNPQNSVQVFGITRAENGQRMLTPLGWLPRRFGIAEDGSINSFNNATKKYTKQQDPTQDPFWHDPAMNKDYVSNGMKKNGIRVLLGNIDKARSGPEAVNSKEPYMHITINDENWAKSIAMADQIGGTTRKEGVASALAQVNTALEGKARQKALAEVRQSVQEPADSIFDSPEAAIVSRVDEPGAQATRAMLASGREAFSAATPQEMAAKLKNGLGIELSDSAVTEIFTKRNEMTVRDFFSMFNEHATSDMKGIFAQTVKPFLESPLFRSGWTYGKSFPELRVMGGIKPKASVEAQNQGVVSPVSVERVSGAPVAQKEQTITIEPLLGAQNGSPAPTTQGTLDFAPESLAGRVSTRAKQEPIKKEQPAQPVPRATTPKVATPQPVPVVPSAAPVRPQQPLTKKEARDAMVRVFSEGKREMELRGQDLMESAVVPDRRAAYISTLRSIMNSIEPGGRVPTATGVRPFSPAERHSMNKGVKERLSMRAEELVNTAFSPENEIMFKLGSLSETTPELKEALLKVVRADTLQKLGAEDAARELLRPLPVEDVKRAAGLMEFKGVDSLLKPKNDVLDKDTSANEFFTGKKQGNKGSSKEEVAYVAKQYKSEGEKEIRQIEEDLKITARDGLLDEMQKYQFAKAKATDTILTRIFGPGYAKDGKVISMLGKMNSDLRLPSPRAEGKTVSVGGMKDMFNTINRSGNLMEKSHTPDYLRSLGFLESGKRSDAITARATETSNAPSARGDKENLTVVSGGDNSGMLSSEDLSSGSMRLVSDTQEENIKGLNDVWTKRYPGLNSLIVGDSANATVKKPTPEEAGVKDARQLVQDLLYILGQKKRYDPSLSGKGLNLVKVSKPFSKMTDQEKAVFKKENEQATTDIFKTILDSIRKELSKRNTTQLTQ